MKILLFLILTSLLMITNVQAARVLIGVGTSYGPNVSYVPGHWYHGYWIPAQYVEYAGPPPGVGYVWYGGGFYGGHRWHDGHWGHHGHHH